MKASAAAKPANAPRSAIEWLDQESNFRELAQRVAGLARLQGQLNASGGLRFPIQVLAVENDTLVVATRSASQAALLRQQAPSLLAAMRQRGTDLREVRVRVRPDLHPRTAARPGIRKPIPEHTLSELSAIAAHSGESHLAQALERLIRHQRRPR
ncbi:MAG: hypothetical protein RLZZ153_928 [Pseudomonadota bacterium]|jgi:hypothetical protein